jgi:exonuclease SbcC
VRPLKLELKGFTAFRDQAAIDFTELEVFAIAGQTGSGKSSLLDAMTYALYGRVERVGDRVSQLISQGQPRMAVTLEFEVGMDRYRVTRSTPAKGATKIQLERLEGGGWRQAGEGSDRVKGADAMIARAIGLTYDGFTRSVLLPQGRFAEFLVGDASKRRDILTELLGLSLFRRMAERAGVIARESSLRAQERSVMVEREYADATPEAVKEAGRAAKTAEKRERALARAGEQVMEILGRWEESKRSLDELRSCVEEATRAAEGAASAAEALEDLVERSRAAKESLDASTAAATAATAELERAGAALRAAQALGGSVADLTKAQVHAHALAEGMRAQAARSAERANAEAASVRLAAAVEAATTSLAERAEALTAAQGAASAAESALEEARHADLVSAVSAGLAPGDPCPVCGVPLRKAPKRTAGLALDRARKRGAAADAALEGARAAAADAQRDQDEAHRDAMASQIERARLDAEIAALEEAASTHRSALASLLGDPLPADPVAALDERLAEVQELDRSERDASRRAADSAQAVTRAEQERDRVGALIDRLEDGLRRDPGPLLDRAARALGATSAPAVLPPPPVTHDPAALGSFATELARELGDLGRLLAGAVEERTSAEDRLLAEAHERIGGLVEEVLSLEALAESVAAACRAATVEAATSAQRAQDLAERLARRRQLAEESAGLDERARLFRSLAQELRADRLIAFLQAEALQLLAMAGSERLSALSDGRYRITCRDDEFFVVDTWNGDEERGVRTLSGGETFLASLALALALADQVRSLSVTDRARLDSLFLDEGFGTLDPETLRTVTDAIEQLGGNGRLVGIITHVRELAEQFPRIEVTKSPRGSWIEFVA